MPAKGTGKYVYKSGTNCPYEWKDCLTCGGLSLIAVRGKYCSQACYPRTGANNPRWKGEDATYVSKHFRVYAARGKAETCVFGKGHGKGQWANLTGNYSDPEDYAAMCASCHQRYDNMRVSMEEGFTKHAHGGKSPEPTQFRK
jgi:hypothetical protein